MCEGLHMCEDLHMCILSLPSNEEWIRDASLQINDDIQEIRAYCLNFN